MDANERKPLPLTFGVSARNQRLSAFIRGSNSGSLDYWNIQAVGLVKIHQKKRCQANR